MGWVVVYLQYVHNRVYYVRIADTRTVCLFVCFFVILLDKCLCYVTHRGKVG